MNIRIGFILVFFLVFFSSKAQVPFFEDIVFDSTTSIACFPSAANPEQYSFLINTIADFNQLKKDWVFEKMDFGKKPENSLSIYVIRNKEGKWLGTIYPGINKITSIRASYLFDNAKLISLSKKHPFKFNIKRETFKSREEYLNQYNKAISEKGYLFPFGPGKWDGTFKINVPSSDSTNTPVAAMNVLNTKLLAIADSGSYSLRYELSEDNRNYQKSYKITVDCSQYVFDHYNDSLFHKADWKPEPMFLTSFWEKH